MSYMSDFDCTLQELAERGQLGVWVVRGDPLMDLWLTKGDAERHARELFPNESPDARYARVVTKRVRTYG